MPTAIFNNHAHHIIQQIKQAKSQIKAAVCWFSHREIFKALLERLQAGISVDLLIEYDNQNIREDGLDFQSFIKAGGRLWAQKGNGLMHHKFAIIDNSVLLTGSFNWTYNLNAENLIIADDPSMIEAFSQEFEAQKIQSKLIRTIRQADVKSFGSWALTASTVYQLPELRLKIGAGARIWIIRADRLGQEVDAILRDSRLYFDQKGIMNSYWNQYKHWDKKQAKAYLEAFEQDTNASLINRWLIRMQTGDLALIFTKKRAQKGQKSSALLHAIGVVQMVPEKSELILYSSCRQVQWLCTFNSEPKPLAVSIGASEIQQYNGSGLRLLSEIFEQP
jgi:phosphatidylserine/phosphatidylglycerophosphate/cardiolipin synthase-like enzyme